MSEKLEFENIILKALKCSNGNALRVQKSELQWLKLQNYNLELTKLIVDAITLSSNFFSVKVLKNWPIRFYLGWNLCFSGTSDKLLSEMVFQFVAVAITLS